MKSSTSSTTNCIYTNYHDGALQINHFPNLDCHIYWHVPLTLYVTGETGANPRMGRQDTGKGDPRSQLQIKRTPTPPKSPRKLSLLLQLQRASCPWTAGVPPFHATRDSDTPPSSLLKVQSQSITSPSPHTIKFSGRARQITRGGLRFCCERWSQKSDLCPLLTFWHGCWHATSLIDACPD